MKHVIQKGNKQPTVLITDNDPDIVHRISNMMENDGFLVLKAYDSEECIALANSSKPDLLLIEAAMPNLDGFNVCERLKHDTKTKDIPVIFISSKNSVTDKVKGFEKGAIDFIVVSSNCSQRKQG